MSVAVQGDAKGEGNEAFRMILALKWGTTTVVSTSATITISEAVVGLSPTSTVAAEGTTASLTVSLSAQPANDVTVNFATRDITAVAGQDYTASSGSFVFKPSDFAPKQIDIAVLKDSLNLEGDETFAIDLSLPANTAGAGLGPASSATITIKNVLPANAAVALPPLYDPSLPPGNIPVATLPSSLTKGVIRLEWILTDANGSPLGAADLLKLKFKKRLGRTLPRNFKGSGLQVYRIGGSFNVGSCKAFSINPKVEVAASWMAKKASALTYDKSTSRFIIDVSITARGCNMINVFINGNRVAQAVVQIF